MRRKITVVGAGNVGATCAQVLATRDYADVVLVDIKEGLPQGKALDINQMGAVLGYEPRVTGSNSYDETKGSDVVVITAGLPRSPGMSRDDLVATNEKIVKDVTEKVISQSPDAILIVVSNPLDAMCHVAKNASGWPKERVFGMAGILDTARFSTFIAWATGSSVKAVTAMVLGGHGDQMVPVVSATTVGGVPLTKLVADDRIEAMVERTRKGGGEIVDLLGTSAWSAPGAAAAQMVDAVMLEARAAGFAGRSIKAAAKRAAIDVAIRCIDLTTLEGRDSPSRGLEIASEYIAAQFRRAGLEPVGDDGYFQTANILMAVPQPAGFSLVISRKEGEIEVGPEQVTMALDTGLDLSRAKLFKVDSNDPASGASLTPEQAGGEVIITERARRGWRDVLERQSALKASLILLVSRQMLRSDGVASRRLIDPARREAPYPSPFAPFMYVVNQNLLNFYDEAPKGPARATVSHSSGGILRWKLRRPSGRGSTLPVPGARLASN